MQGHLMMFLTIFATVVLGDCSDNTTPSTCRRAGCQWTADTRTCSVKVITCSDFDGTDPGRCERAGCYWKKSDKTCSDTDGKDCTEFTGDSAACKEHGCKWTPTDQTCGDADVTPAPAVDCGLYWGKPEACTKKGCTYNTEDKMCCDGPCTPAPEAVCSDYDGTDPGRCSRAGCYWNAADKTCNDDPVTEAPTVCTDYWGKPKACEAKGCVYSPSDKTCGSANCGSFSGTDPGQCERQGCEWKAEDKTCHDPHEMPTTAPPVVAPTDAPVAPTMAPVDPTDAPTEKPARDPCNDFSGTNAKTCRQAGCVWDKSDGSCNEAQCSDFRDPNACKRADCQWNAVDKTCTDPHPSECSEFDNDAAACKESGCQWHPEDDTCTDFPTPAPTVPTDPPTEAPVAPTMAPVDPTDPPTEEPTAEPSASPTADPTESPTDMPTADPTAAPTYHPTVPALDCFEDLGTASLCKDDYGRYWITNNLTGEQVPLHFPDGTPVMEGDEDFEWEGKAVEVTSSLPPLETCNGRRRRLRSSINQDWSRTSMSYGWKRTATGWTRRRSGEEMYELLFTNDDGGIAIFHADSSGEMDETPDNECSMSTADIPELEERFQIDLRGPDFCHQFDKFRTCKPVEDCHWQFDDKNCISTEELEEKIKNRPCDENGNKAQCDMNPEKCNWSYATGSCMTNGENRRFEWLRRSSLWKTTGGRNYRKTRRRSPTHVLKQAVGL